MTERQCAYCKQEIRYDPYQGLEGNKYTVSINGIQCEITLHSKCIPELISDYFSNKTGGK